MIPDLRSLALKHGTTKMRPDTEHYVGAYAQFFEPMRTRPIRLLEIGVQSGNSLRMWKEYFPHGEIHGLDIDPECKQVEENRIIVHIGDQREEETYAGFPEEFDIIIDDSSHVPDHQLELLILLADRCKSFYAIEDLRTSYLCGRDKTAMPTLFDLVHSVNWPVSYEDDRSWLKGEHEKFLAGRLRSVHFYLNLCIIEMDFGQ